MKSSEIRQKFLDYFQAKQHAIVASSALIPGNDPTLLFTNAGMVQFKDVFLGEEKRSYTRAATAQTCLRAGGKHNDLDNVGYTARHHTFFEMLGNFSFGDYFKEDAIKMAWEFITKVLAIPAEKLIVTVHDSDQEAKAIWMEKIGLAENRVIKCGDKDNFWSMGDTGPCGPCTEIFYDHGDNIPGGPPGSAEADGDRYIEIWNLVFMQFNRTLDGQLHPLPKPSVDTGMGLERLSAVMQGVHNNYETDLFVGIIAAAAACIEMEDLSHPSLRVIADHIRSSAFLIKDGVVPSNEGRGYVLRRIIRRALRHGYKLNMPKHFFSKLVPSLVDIMANAYPDLAKAQKNIEAVLQREEEAFAMTLDQGMKLLEKRLASLSSIPGDLIFKLYDTYGFPVDLTADIAREHDLDMDYAGYEKCMEEQKERSRQAGKFDINYNAKETLLQALKDKKSEFLRHTTENEASLIAVFEDMLVLDKTSFYPEGGGQVGDVGEIIGQNFLFRVENTTREGEVILHHGKKIQGEIRLGDRVISRIDVDKRKATMRHHSATHLLHEALQKVLGSHVQQKGSLVSPERLRFDFSHFESISKEHMRDIEKRVNAHIVNNDDVDMQEMPIDEAKSAGAMALFGEKYGDVVRTIKMGTSFELCGGTHVTSTGDIGAFKIISEGSIASGIRRIEAVAGPLAWEVIYNEQDAANREHHAAILKQKELEKNIEQLKSKIAAHQAMHLLSQVKKVASIHVLIACVDEADAKTLSSIIEVLKQKLNPAVIVLAANHNNVASLMVSVSSELHEKIKASTLVQYLAPIIEGKGGGRADIAQAGGKAPKKIYEMLAKVEPWIDQHFL